MSAVPATKAARHALIARLLAHQPIVSQADLSRRLGERGLSVTQATLSRDLLEMRASKVAVSDGTQVYALPAQGAAGALSLPEAPEEWHGTARLGRWCAELLVSAEAAGRFVVLRTPAGAAQLLASAIDQAVLAPVLGTIAGDDTVMIITREESDGHVLARRLLDLARPGDPGGVPAGPEPATGPTTETPTERDQA